MPETSDVASLRAASGGSSRSMVVHAQDNAAYSVDENRNGHKEVFGTLQARREGGGFEGAVSTPTVRRLTPRECERLQGFPDDFTAITYRNKPAADGPRYKALGNSMAVPVIGWILARIYQLQTDRMDQ